MIKVTFIDSGREPKVKPNPKYPDGIDVDMSDGTSNSCIHALPYPAPRCGFYMVDCNLCDLRVGITVAGRPDDPRSVKLPCKKRPCPHCGGDESKCDFEFLTGKCSQQK